MLDSSLPYTRRQFLNRSLVLISTIGTAPAFLSRSSLLLAAPAPASALAAGNVPGKDEGRILVVVQLSGGNDGLNTVIPCGFPAYYKLRPGIAVPEKQVLMLDDSSGGGIGIHPNMTALFEMIGNKRAAIIQGVGYPNPNHSHFASMDIWHSGVNLDEDQPVRAPHGTGWIGRALDSSPLKSDVCMDCIAIGSEAPPATRGRIVQPVAFERSDMFRWAGDSDEQLDAIYEQLQNEPADLAPSDSAAAFVFRTAMDAQVASDKVRKAVGRKNETTLPRSDLGRQLAAVANMIRAELPTRVYYVAMGGFDTHANQTGRQPNLLRDFSEAMAAFYRELDATGNGSRVVSVAFSEFGRRAAQNASQGTDHGEAGPVFIFGDHLALDITSGGGCGLIGQHPALDKLNDGNLAYQTDFRSVYSELLTNWMQLDAKAALGRAYPPLKLIRD
ncbi:MAG: DUF1501 domain-containing protein [Phycisphaeraceae bacterium]|nr:DUF1501 domain-containing protein [Phycisphaeraceae bacterium]